MLHIPNSCRHATNFFLFHPLAVIFDDLREPAPRRTRASERACKETGFRSRRFASVRCSKFGPSLRYLMTLLQLLSCQFPVRVNQDINRRRDGSGVDRSDGGQGKAWRMFMREIGMYARILYLNSFLRMYIVYSYRKSDRLKTPVA